MAGKAKYVFNCHFTLMLLVVGGKKWFLLVLHDVYVSCVYGVVW